MNKFDRLFWKRLWGLVEPYWISREKGKALGLLAIIGVLSAGSVALRARFSYLNRDLTNSLQAYNAPRFHQLLAVFMVYVGLVVAIFPLRAYLIGLLGLRWREWITDRFMGLGLRDHVFYRINLSGRIDNPDQRIQEDIDTFSSQTLRYVLTGLTSIAMAVTFVGILWSISPWLALTLIAYCTAGSYGTVAVGRRLVAINFDQRRYEANFRFGLVHVRDNAESIALYDGEKFEAGQLDRRFSSVVNNFKLLLRWQYYLQCFTSGFDDLIALLPWAVLAGAYFAHQMQLGQFTQAAYAFAVIKGALSLVVDEFQSFATYASVVNRLATLREECETAASGAGESAGIVNAENGRVAMQNLTVMTPDRAITIVTDVSLDIRDDERLLITGQSGTGKTSLLRAIAGIWSTGSGRVAHPAARQMMFLPQRPYMTLGSLRDQLCYPRRAGASEEELQRVLREVNLTDLAERMGGFDVELNWQDVLSPGEQQRVAFARLFLDRPRYAFLDEATSALDSSNEEQLYRRLAASPIIYTSVAHRSTLARYHTRSLELTGEGKWRLARTAAPLAYAENQG